jgi:hypothetical protein
MADENKSHCTCGQCRTRGLMGPLMVITIGVLFLIHQYSHYNFGELWPVILIVAGIVMVAQSLASKSGHIGS